MAKEKHNPYNAMARDKQGHGYYTVKDKDGRVHYVKVNANDVDKYTTK